MISNNATDLSILKKCSQALISYLFNSYTCYDSIKSIEFIAVKNYNNKLFSSLDKVAIPDIEDYCFTQIPVIDIERTLKGNPVAEKYSIFGCNSNPLTSKVVVNNFIKIIEQFSNHDSNNNNNTYIRLWWTNAQYINTQLSHEAIVLDRLLTMKCILYQDNLFVSPQQIVVISDEEYTPYLVAGKPTIF